MTKEEVKLKMLDALGVDISDFDEEATMGSFYDEGEEFDDAVQRVADAFDIDVETIDLDTTLVEMVDGICAHFGISE